MDFLVINDNELIRDFESECIKSKINEEEDRISGKIKVMGDCEFSLCFLLHESEVQNLDFDIEVEENSHATMIMNCALVEGIHNSNFKIHTKKNSSLKIVEKHFHGSKDIEVNARVCLNADISSKVSTVFDMVSGYGGRINYFLCSNLHKNSSVNSLFKGVFKGNDNIDVEENFRLIGEASSVITKIKAVGRENSNVIFKGKIVGEGENSIGHLECNEIVMDKAIVKTIPALEVINETSRLTHEAAIGKIEEGKINLLMAKGLEKEEAIEKIISGILE